MLLGMLIAMDLYIILILAQSIQQLMKNLKLRSKNSVLRQKVLKTLLRMSERILQIMYTSLNYKRP